METHHRKTLEILEQRKKLYKILNNGCGRFLPTHLIFGTVKDTNNIYYSTKNQLRGLCVGGDMAIVFFGNFKWIRENRPPRK